MVGKLSNSEQAKLMGERLREARLKKGYKSIPQVLEKFRWKLHAFRSHDAGLKKFSDEAAKQYGAAFDVPPEYLLLRDITDGWVDPRAKQPSRPVPNASFPPIYQRFSQDHSIPLLGRTKAGPNGRFIMNGTEIGRVFCPPGLEGVEGAYAVQVTGTSGLPRFRENETVWVNPHLRVFADDDVVVQIIPDDDDQPVESYIKQYKGRSASRLRLWQYNPAPGESHDLEFDARSVFAVHKVVFHATI